MAKTSKKPVKVKEEPKDVGGLHSLSHYVDDRVDFVKQLFGALKPKTIKSLAPGFLKKSSLGDLEELCLNELLGISTKRLLSIINATKCPTDTESSDSDLENVEEHISLEEISSDSETERAKKSKKKKPEKELTVLELLELQARARAIRSQLALEPIAKIEVESDESSNSESENEKRTAKNNVKSTLIKTATSTKPAFKDNNRASTSKTTKSKTPEKLSVISNGKHKTKYASNSNQNTKRVKLKRNFRKNGGGDLSGTESIKSNTLDNKKEAERIQETEPKEDTKEENPKMTERSPSPDVITILQSPETFYVSNSSDDEPADTERLTDIGKKKIEMVKNSEKNSLVESSTSSGREENTKKEKKKIEDFEDGEIDDDEELDSKEDVDASVQNSPDNNTISNVKQPNENDKTVEEDSSKNSTMTSALNETPNDSELNNTTNDDVLILNHEEIDYDIKDVEDKNDDDDSQESTKRKTFAQQLVEPSSPQKQSTDSTPKSQEEICDFIDLHDDSSDPEDNANSKKREDNPSWNTRWLQSSKVSKVLATSRIGSRLRVMMRKQKAAIEQQAERDETTPENSNQAAANTFESKYEDGSVQQYKEIKEVKIDQEEKDKN